MNRFHTFQVDYVANLTSGGSVLGSVQVISVDAASAAASASAMLDAADNLSSHGVLATHDLGVFDLEEVGA